MLNCCYIICHIYNNKYFSLYYSSNITVIIKKIIIKLANQGIYIFYVDLNNYALFVNLTKLYNLSKVYPKIKIIINTLNRNNMILDCNFFNKIFFLTDSIVPLDLVKFCKKKNIKLSIVNINKKN
ncbi:hypothetical protein SAMN03080614_103014 [Anaerobranca gottschalkii DSM 13577]|uniref:Uncharacterized protein n=1 Tax=Anaerobranca gottschalkii DSM 13577 TaxID=1120990 RepID=A0A1I0B257_9FIRM|nr:hypothetical protein SAMN03080614_103014 [Anaerobranca gottschalkii DSM 13577]